MQLGKEIIVMSVLGASFNIPFYFLEYYHSLGTLMLKFHFIYLSFSHAMWHVGS